MKKLKMQYSPEPLHSAFKKRNQPSISDMVKSAYTSSFCEASTLLTYNKVKNQDDFLTVRYCDLQNTEVSGMPIGSDRDEFGNLQFTFAKKTPNTHVISIGTTGSGKTTGFVEPCLRAVSMKKNKANLFVTDPKGELFEHNAKHLQNQGYSIYLMNFKDVLHSNCWNPLSEIYDVYMRQKGLKDKLMHIRDKNRLSEFTFRGQKEEIKDDFWVFDNFAFATEAEAKRRYEDVLAEILSETADLIHQIVHTLIPDTLVAKQDPSWHIGSQQILSGLLYAMLEDALDDRSGFTRDNMNLMTVQDYFDSIRKEMSLGISSLLGTKKMSHKKDNDTSIKQLRTYFENAPTTARCYMSCFRNSLMNYFNNKIYTITNGNDIFIDDDSEKPFAIFLVTRDFEKSDFTIAGMFVDWIYRKMLEKADSQGGRLPREMYFMLDEFANIPPIKDFENKIATARSRNIWFNIFIQSYSQLEMVYEPSTAQTIIDNCNSLVFIGSLNYDTKSRFARECGKQSIPALESVLNPQNHRIIEAPLINIKQLESLEAGKMYMKRSEMPLTLTEFIRSYQCEEFFSDRHITPEDLGIESLPFNSEKYRYLFLESNKTMADFNKEAHYGYDHINVPPIFSNSVI
jgi:type IV secretion system protein VirD4